MKWPDMISTKDLAYISDMYNWNNTLKAKLEFFIEEAFDEDIVPYLQKALDVVENNCQKLTKLLEKGDEDGK